jgi:hypothetical protein
MTALAFLLLWIRARNAVLTDRLRELENDISMAQDD